MHVPMIHPWIHPTPSHLISSQQTKPTSTSICFPIQAVYRCSVSIPKICLSSMYSMYLHTPQPLRVHPATLSLSETPLVVPA